MRIYPKGEPLPPIDSSSALEGGIPIDPPVPDPPEAPGGSVQPITESEDDK